MPEAQKFPRLALLQNNTRSGFACSSFTVAVQCQPHRKVWRYVELVTFPYSNGNERELVEVHFIYAKHAGKLTEMAYSLKLCCNNLEPSKAGC